MNDYIVHHDEPIEFPDGRYSYESIRAPRELAVSDDDVCELCGPLEGDLHAPTCPIVASQCYIDGLITETDLVDSETRWQAFGQCAECGEPDRIMSQVAGLCVTCDARLREGWE